METQHQTNFRTTKSFDYNRFVTPYTRQCTTNALTFYLNARHVAAACGCLCLDNKFSTFTIHYVR